MMRKAGLIYHRDTSKSHHKNSHNNTPLSSNHHHQQEHHNHKVLQSSKSAHHKLTTQKPHQKRRQTRPSQKGWRVQLDNVTQSSNTNSMQTNQGYFETDCRSISDNQSFFQVRTQKCSADCSKSDYQLASKMVCIERVLQEMKKLRDCQLKSSQKLILDDIQAKLLHLQKRMLKQQKQNCLK